MEFGTIVKLNQQKLYGFIATGNGDIFFHQSGLVNRAFRQLATGYEVEFRRDMSKMHGKEIAVDVRVVEP
jgi:cold shock CspA family protein